MWYIWREWNNRIFEGEECSIIELKSHFLLSLFERRTALSGLVIPSVLDFLDLCNFGYTFASLYAPCLSRIFFFFGYFSSYFQ